MFQKVQGCFKIVIRIIHGIFKVVSRVSYLSVKKFSVMFEGGVKKVFRNVSRVLMEVSMLFPECFKEVSRKF